MKRIPALLSLALLLPPFSATAATPSDSDSDRQLAAYFRAETETLSTECLADIHSRADWTRQREEYRRKLQDMLGLHPWPPRTDLKPVITGKLDHEEFTVEKLHFQALPGLYVTANFYLPRQTPGPVPVILYLCGHSRQITNGISFGNKTGYQHHGAWFARNGYAALLIDTVELGEIQGQHRGTYSKNQWWWNSRGYTPAGVEAWFGIRALDYLCSRPEVDHNRIGLTGRSGGGAYTWTVAALDDRVKVAAPVAGITDVANHVIDGTVDGHCDCMFHINTYRWDFAAMAALIAPRPLMIGNTDKDKIFPLEGVVRVHEATRKIYRLYQAPEKLALLITEGPHGDTQDLQLPVFRWFNRWLKGEEPVIEMAARKFFAPAELRVFQALPSDEINTRIDQTFVPAADPACANSTNKYTLIEGLLENVFGGWPDDPVRFAPVLLTQSRADRLQVRTFRFSSQPHVDLKFHLVQDPSVHKPRHVILKVLADPGWNQQPSRLLSQSHSPGSELDNLAATKSALVLFAPRGIGESWSTNAARFTQVRRRFMLLGQTLDSMRVWDIRCAVNSLRTVPGLEKATVIVQADGSMAVNAAYAALFEPGIARLRLSNTPASHATGPDYLNVMKFTDVPHVLNLLGDRVETQPGL